MPGSCFELLPVNTVLLTVFSKFVLVLVSLFLSDVFEDERVAVEFFHNAEVAVIAKLEVFTTANEALRKFVVVFNCLVSNSLICEVEFAFE